MADTGLIELAGGRSEKPTKYVSLAYLKWIAGLQYQRSVFASLDTRYNSKFLGGKPDALIDGGNCEISNKLILQRRPGLSQYGTASIPPPLAFYEWQAVSPSYLSLVVDTASALYNYSPANAGIYFDKSAAAGQTNVYDLVNTLYAGDGADLYKITGQNLLTQSNNFSISPWVPAGVTVVNGGTPDPVGGNSASQFNFSTTGSGVFIGQPVFPNYTPVANNTFTFSCWMQLANGANPNTITLIIEDQVPNNVIVEQSFVVTSGWAKYQITGTMQNTSTSVYVFWDGPTTTNAINVYGAQLEVGGPASPTTITTNKPLGVYQWGIAAPTMAPSFTLSAPTNIPIWKPNTNYSTGGGLTLTSVSTGGIYHGTITGGASNGKVGQYFKVTGFANAANNSIAPGFLCTASTTTTLTLNNFGSIAETHAGNALQLSQIIDSNGNLEVAYVPGKSGGSAPVWNMIVGGSTQDGLQNLVIQSTLTLGTSSASIAFPANVTSGNTLLAFVGFKGGSWTSAPTAPTGFTFLGNAYTNTFQVAIYYKLSATGGATTVAITTGGDNTFLGIAEISPQTSIDTSAGNTAHNSLSGLFYTGDVNTINAIDTIITFAMFQAASVGFEIGTAPSGYQIVCNQPSVVNIGGAWNFGVALTTVSAAGGYNPLWTITNTAPANDIVGLTVALETAAGTLVWYNVGTNITTGLSPATGYQYYYSFVNTYTGHRSNVSPVSATTGPFVGQKVNVSGVGMQTVNSGGPNQDPQVDAIEVYRNYDGGAFWYQIPPSLMSNTSGIITVNGVEYLSNPGNATSAGNWFFTDSVPDDSLNTLIFAPIGSLNSPPPTGLNNLEFFASRLWGAVGNYLYYNTGADNAALLNILQNGVPPESWVPTNYIPFPTPIIRTLAMGAGLVVFTTTDVWLVVGQNVTNFTPIKILAGHGLRSYNAVTIDGSTAYIYTSDRECLMMNPSGASVEYGFAIGNVVEQTYNPSTVYLARHVSGSQDNALYLANGTTGWYRLNPSMPGASMSGEPAPIWSPFATIMGGCGAIASIETSPGVKQLLVGQTVSGPVLVRNINTFTDNGTPYTWFANIGSMVLTTSGMLSYPESITTQMVAGDSTQVSVGVLLDEISGTFESIPLAVNDPPQLITSTSVLSNRFYLSQGTDCPLCTHMQVQLSGAAVATQDEVLAVTIRGFLIPEQV